MNKEMERMLGMCKHCGSKEHKTSEHKHEKTAKGKALKGRMKMDKVDAPGSKGIKR